MELWELAQGEVEKASIEWFAELLWEQPDVDDIAALGHAMIACKTHFRFQPPDFEIFTAEKVALRMAEREKQEARERIISAGHSFFRALWDKHTRNKALPAEPEEGVCGELKELIMKRLAQPDDHEVEQLWKQLTKGMPEDQHQAFHLGCAWGIIPAHYNFWFDRASYAPGEEWVPPFAEAISTLKSTVQSRMGSSVNTPFISVDSSTTKDIDDAFCIEQKQNGDFHLRIALACPAFGWPFGSEFDREVLRRATSVYLPEGTSNMMPAELANDFYSLVATEPRPTLVLNMHIGADGTVQECTIECTQATVAVNLNYVDCEAVLHGGGEDTPAHAYAEQLALAFALATVRQQYRVQNGAVIIERPDPKTTVQGQGAATSVTVEAPDPTADAMLLIGEMMLLANSSVALWAKERGITLLHRTQDVAVPKEYVGIWSQPHDIARVVKALSSAVLETSPRPHRGIGVEAYSPVTSPLRRYPDLINMSQIISYLEAGTPRLDKAELDALLPLLNARLDAVGQIQRFRPRYWKLQYVKQEGDKKWWDAVVTDENDLFVTVSLPDLQIFVRGKRQTFGDKVYPGQHFQVRAGKVHPLNNEIQILDAMEE